MPKTTRFVDYEPVTRRSPTASTSDKDLQKTLAKAEPDPAKANSPELLQVAPTDANSSPKQGRGLPRGHLLSYWGLLLFTIVLNFRPQEYVPGLASVQIALFAAIITLLAFIPSQLVLEGSLTARPREVNLLLLLTLAALLSVPLAVSPGDAIHTFWEPFLKDVIVFIIIVNAVRTERRLKGMFYLALAVTCTLCFTALNDYRLGNLTVEGYRISGSITGGMFDNSNDLGIHLVTMIPLVLMLGFAARNFLGKIFYWTITLLAVATLVVTFSRGAFIGLLASILVMSWKLARRSRAIVIISLVIGVLVFVAAAPGTYWTRILSIFDPSLDAFGSSTARSEVLAQSFLVALRHPLFGIGIGNFSLVSARGLVSHNSYTQVASEMGMAALLLYSMFITAPLNRLLKIERETIKVAADSRFYYIAVGLQGSLIGYMFSSFFVSVAYYWFIYYLVGYAVCFRRIYEARTTEKVVEGANAQSLNRTHLIHPTPANN